MEQDSGALKTVIDLRSENDRLNAELREISSRVVPIAKVENDSNIDTDQKLIILECVEENERLRISNDDLVRILFRNIGDFRNRP